MNPNLETETTKVLIVDDDEINLKLLDFVCKNLGFQTILCKNGMEAIEFYTMHFPKVVFMDIDLPILNGIESARRIRSIEKFANKKCSIFANSASILPLEEINKNNPFDLLLQKPLDLNFIKEILT